MRSNTTKTLLTRFALFCAAFALCTSASAMKYKSTKGTLIRADIYHPAKHIIAKSKRLKGSVTVKAGDKGTYKLSGKLTVKIRSLRSGNRRRDRAMWSALGKSRQHRIVYFPKTLKIKGNTGTITGSFAINRNKKKVTLTVTEFSGKVDGKSPITIKVKGKLSCDDYKIKKPSLLFVKIKDKVDVSMTLKFVPAKK